MVNIMSSRQPHRRIRVRETLADADPISAEDLLQDHQPVEAKRCSFADVVSRNPAVTEERSLDMDSAVVQEHFSWLSSGLV